MSSIQGYNNNKPLSVVLKRIQGAKGSAGNTLWPLGGSGGGQWIGLWDLYSYCNQKDSTVIFLMNFSTPLCHLKQKIALLSFRIKLEDLRVE